MLSKRFITERVDRQTIEAARSKCDTSQLRRGAAAESVSSPKADKRAARAHNRRAICEDSVHRKNIEQQRSEETHE
jgi:hypothetical protein